MLPQDAIFEFKMHSVCDVAGHCSRRHCL